jgi:hypothetical protein
VEVRDSNEQIFPVFNIWTHLFCMYELTTILRQRHGLPYAEAMNRLRTGNHTEADIRLLKTFEINPAYPPPEYSIFYRHIFSTHKQRDEHNLLVLKTTTADEVQVLAKDSVLAPFVHEKDKQFFLQEARALDDTKTATLFSVLELKVGIILEISTNVDIPNGLYNGAWGHLRYIEPPGTSTPSVLWIDFFNARIGLHARSIHAKLYDTRPQVPLTCMPVFRVAQTFQATS